MSCFSRGLSSSPEQVTIVERDQLTDGTTPRRGFAKPSRPRADWPLGRDRLELFPGLLGRTAWRTVRAAGTTSDLSRSTSSSADHLVTRSRPRSRSGSLITHQRRQAVHRMSRPTPSSARSRTCRCSTDTTSSTSPRPTVGHGRVSTVADHSASPGADLTVDATGRGSRTPAVLQRLGYGRPRSRNRRPRHLFQCAGSVSDGTLGTHLRQAVRTGASPRFVMFRAEDEGGSSCGHLRFGRFADHPGRDRGLRRRLGGPAALAAARATEPLGEVCGHRSRPTDGDGSSRSNGCPTACWSSATR